MIKIFTTNKDGKVLLTPDEIKSMLDEAYWEGYKANNHLYTYTTPTWTQTPYTVTCSSSSCSVQSSVQSTQNTQA